MRNPLLRYTDEAGPQVLDLDRPATLIGRSPGQDLVLTHPCVSRQHAIIAREDGAYTIIDQKSTHGTFLNGARVERALLKRGDILHIGSLTGPRLEIDAGIAAPELTGSSQTTTISLLSGLSELSLPTDASQPPAGRELEQLNWLLRAARQLNEGGAIEDVLGALLQLTLQLTKVERGFVFLRRDGEMHLAKGMTADGALVEEDSTVSRNAMQKAIHSGAKFSVSDTLSHSQAPIWSSIVINNIRSVYCIPLRTRPSPRDPGQLLGLLYLDSRFGPGALTAVDHQLLDTLSTEAAALLHNALLAEEEQKALKAREELAVAARIHSGLMSTTLPRLPYAVLQAKSVPCLAIGGDFYDAVVLNDCVCVTIADVSGKGVPAAIVAATIQGIIHAQLMAGQSLPEIAALLNQFLCARNVGKYATLVMLKLYPDARLEYINCGHIQPLSVLGGNVRRLEESNLIVGLIPSATYTSTHCTVQPGERILLVTDGVTEAEDITGRPFGDAGLDTLVHLQDVGAILDRIADFQSPHLAEDDCTLLELRYNAP